MNRGSGNLPGTSCENGSKLIRPDRARPAPAGWNEPWAALEAGVVPLEGQPEGLADHLGVRPHPRNLQTTAQESYQIPAPPPVTPCSAIEAHQGQEPPSVAEDQHILLVASGEQSSEVVARLFVGVACVRPRPSSRTARELHGETARALQFP